MIPDIFYLFGITLISIAVCIFLICVWTIADDLTKIRKLLFMIYVKTLKDD